MAATIRVYRLSLIWTDVELGRFDQTGHLSKLRRRADFETTIDALRLAHGRDTDLRLPWWRKVPPHFFWLYYFNSLLPDRIDGAKAWKALAPVQLSVPLARLDMSGGVSGEVRGYIAPQSAAIVAEVKGVSALSPDAWVEQCHAIRGGRLNVTGQDGTAGSMRLQEAAVTFQARLRSLLGQKTAERALSEPFTVITVLQADGIPVDREPSKDVRRRAHAVTAWPSAWRQVAADTSGSIKLRQRDLTKSDLLYGATRGRAIWMPSRFQPTDGPSAS